MKQYHKLLDHVLETGADRGDRTGTGTRSVFGYQMRFNLADGFPLLTTKRVHFRSVAEELFWFLRGETNVRSLQAAGVSIWDEWADNNGDLGPVYGKQWRSWAGVGGQTFDQIANVIARLKADPDSRRLVVSAWNPAELDDMALPPCHCLFQFHAVPMSICERERWLRKDQGHGLPHYESEPARLHAFADALGVPRYRLSCQLYQRSADVFLGVPFNIASYALLVHLIAHHVGMAVGDFVWTGGDVHLYSNHFRQAYEQLARKPRPLPTLRLRHDTDKPLEALGFGDVELVDYEPYPAIKAPVAV